MQKTKKTAQLLLPIFPEETHTSHAKNLRFEFLSCNPTPGILY